MFTPKLAEKTLVALIPMTAGRYIYPYDIAGRLSRFHPINK